MKSVKLVEFEINSVVGWLQYGRKLIKEGKENKNMARAAIPLEKNEETEMKTRNTIPQRRKKGATITHLHLAFLIILIVINKCDSSEEEEQRSIRWWWPSIERLSTMGRVLLGEDPLLLSGKHEGDVVLYPGENPYSKNAEEKNAVAQSSKLWPGGVIPYDFSTGYTVLPFERFLIERVMRDIERKSCVRFVPRTGQDDYVRIIFDSYKCYSSVGRKGGEQVLSLGIFCVMFYDRGNVYHELLHVLGFHHEHNRPDRDDHIDVMWRNIRAEARNNFVKRDHSAVDVLGLPYDIDSVMHYSPHAFSKMYYVLPTLVSHQRGIFFTRSRWPSKLDYAKLNRLYQCHNPAFYHHNHHDNHIR